MARTKAGDTSTRDLALCDRPTDARSSRLSAVVMVAVLLIACTGTMSAGVTIIYTVSDTASGMLGTTSFTNALVTMSFTGNTANVFQLVSGFYENDIGTATVSISGIGTATFTDAMYVADNQNFNPPVAGIADSSCVGCPGVALGTFDSAFGSYDLQSAIGPISGFSDFRTDLSYGTTAGLLNFTGTGFMSTFTAINLYGDHNSRAWRASSFRHGNVRPVWFCSPTLLLARGIWVPRVWRCSRPGTCLVSGHEFTHADVEPQWPGLQRGCPTLVPSFWGRVGNEAVDDHRHRARMGLTFLSARTRARHPHAGR